MLSGIFSMMNGVKFLRCLFGTILVTSFMCADHIYIYHLYIIDIEMNCSTPYHGSHLLSDQTKRHSLTSRKILTSYQSRTKPSWCLASLRHPKKRTEPIPKTCYLQIRDNGPCLETIILVCKSSSKPSIYILLL